MGWKKLTVIVVAAAALVGGALSLSMYLTRQQELEMEVADQKPQPPQAGDTTTLADMENMPIYYDDDEAEKLFTVVQLLGVEQMTSNITIGFNLDSKKLGKKGIIKIADKFFCDEEINRISVVAPHVKLNIIRDYEVVEKKEVKMPDELRGIVKCANPKCITNNEPMATIFHVIDKDNCIVKCHYCEKEQKREEITIL